MLRLSLTYTNLRMLHLNPAPAKPNTRHPSLSTPLRSCIRRRNRRMASTKHPTLPFSTAHLLLKRSITVRHRAHPMNMVLLHQLSNITHLIQARQLSNTRHLHRLPGTTRLPVMRRAITHLRNPLRKHTTLHQCIPLRISTVHHLRPLPRRFLILDLTPLPIRTLDLNLPRTSTILHLLRAP